MNPIEELLREANIITKKDKVNPKFRRMLQDKPIIANLLTSQPFFEGQDLKLIIRMILDGHCVHPKCKTCSSLTSYNYQKGYFNDHCSKKCAWKDPDTILKRENTKKDRYGTSTYNNRPKAYNTNKERYGVENPLIRYNQKPTNEEA